MKQKKHKFNVFSQHYVEHENPECSYRGKWNMVGETWAVSEKQAINNVRHRKRGDYYSSQYKPRYVSGHWEEGEHWKAEAVM